MADMNTSQEFHATIRITNAAGEDRPVQSQPVWAGSDDTIIKVVPGTDGMSAVISAVAVGSGARVTVSADADLGEGVTTITGVSEDINVTQDPNQQASTIQFNLGAPVPKGTTA